MGACFNLKFKIINLKLIHFHFTPVLITVIIECCTSYGS